MWKYMYLNGIFKYIEKFKADELIIALDSQHNWRKKIFPFYKSSRKIIRDSKDEEEGWFNYKDYFEVYNDFLKQIEKYLPFKVIQVDTSEADDIAGVLCNSDILGDNAKILITTDKDFVQLLDCPLTSLYNPILKKFVECSSPKKQLYKKILLGDKGDDVPSVRDTHHFKEAFLQYCVNEGLAQNETNAKIKLESDEMMMLKMEHEFQMKYPIKAATVRVFSKKIVEPIVEQGKVKEYLRDNPDLKKNFLRNNKLVNLKCQPKELISSIVEEYTGKEIQSKMMELSTFFIANSFIQFINTSTHITSTLKPLYT